MTIHSAGKKKKSPRRLWVGMAAGLLVLGGLAAAAYFLGLLPVGRAETASAAATTVEIRTVRKGSLRSSITGSGTYAAGKSVDLSFSTTGQVAELNTALGETISAGQVLARLGDTEALDAAVAAAQLQVLEAQANLEELQGGAGVALAQAYVEWVAAKGEQATALTAQQRTLYARCSEDVNTQYAAALQRAEERLAEQTRGTEAYTNARYDLDTAQANYAYCISYTPAEKTAAQAELDLAARTLEQTDQKYQLLSASAGIDPQDLQMAEATLEQAQAALKDAQTTLAGATITAPISGKVTYLAAQPGENVTGGEIYLTISDLSQPVLNVQVDETDWSSFTVGSQAEVVFDALPDQVFTGMVTVVSPQTSSNNFLNALSGTLALDAAPIFESLPLGVSATVEIIVAEAQDVLLIPVEALEKQPDGSYTVMVVDNSGAQTERAVTIGLQDGVSVEITAGVSEGEQVAVTGTLSSDAASTNQMQPGMEIRIESAPGGGAMPPSGGPGMP